MPKTVTVHFDGETFHSAKQVFQRFDQYAPKMTNNSFAHQALIFTRDQVPKMRKVQALQELGENQSCWLKQTLWKSWQKLAYRPFSRMKNSISRSGEMTEKSAGSRSKFLTDGEAYKNRVRIAMFTTRGELLEKIRLWEDNFLELKKVRFAGGKLRGQSKIPFPC